VRVPIIGKYFLFHRDFPSDNIKIINTTAEIKTSEAQRLEIFVWKECLMISIISNQLFQMNENSREL
jgi:hypothetical protein